MRTTNQEDTMQSSNLSEALATFQLDTSTVLEKSAIMMKTFLCLDWNDSKVRRTNRALFNLSIYLTSETTISSTIYLYDVPEWKSYLVPQQFTDLKPKNPLWTIKWPLAKQKLQVTAWQFFLQTYNLSLSNCMSFKKNETRAAIQGFRQPSQVINRFIHCRWDHVSENKVWQWGKPRQNSLLISSVGDLFNSLQKHRSWRRLLLANVAQMICIPEEFRILGKFQFWDILLYHRWIPWEWEENRMEVGDLGACWEHCIMFAFHPTTDQCSTAHNTACSTYSTIRIHIAAQMLWLWIWGT